MLIPANSEGWRVWFLSLYLKLAWGEQVQQEYGKKKKKKSWDKLYKAAWDLGQGCVVKESNFLASEELREASVWMSLDKLASAEEEVPLLLGISHSLERSWHHKVLMFTACCCWCTKHSSVQSLSHVRLCATPWTAACQDSRPSPTPGACSNSCPSSRWHHSTILSSVVSFSSCLQSFPASGGMLRIGCKWPL